MKPFLFVFYSFCKFFVVKTLGKKQLALTLTENHVGFAPFDPYSDEQKLEIEDGKISRKNKKVCTSPITSEVRLCTTAYPINASFEPISIEEIYKFKTKGNNVLAVGDYNESTEMFDAINIPESLAVAGKYFFTLTEQKTEPKFNHFKSMSTAKN